MTDQYLMLKYKDTGKIEFTKLKKDWLKDIIASSGPLGEEKDVQTLIKTDGVDFSEVNLKGSLDGAKRWVNRKDHSLLFELIVENSHLEKKDETDSIKHLLLKRGNGGTLVIERFINYRDIEALLNAEKTAQENKQFRQEIKKLREEKKTLQENVELKDEEILANSEKMSKKYNEKVKKLLKDREKLYDEVSELYDEVDSLIETITIAYGVNIKAPAEKFQERLQKINQVIQLLKQEPEEEDEEDEEVEEEELETEEIPLEEQQEVERAHMRAILKKHETIDTQSVQEKEEPQEEDEEKEEEEEKVDEH